MPCPLKYFVQFAHKNAFKIKISYIKCMSADWSPDSHGLWELLLLRVCALGESSIAYLKCLMPILNSEITVLKKPQTNKKDMLTLVTNLKCILIS